jgi:hypothetical protein
MNTKPTLSTREQIYSREGYQALEASVRPAHWGVDLDPARRPGVPRERSSPRPFPNTRYPPEAQQGEPASPMHGRSNKTMPPVFGTSCPLHGPSGLVRRLAYKIPDHYARHWLLMMLGDRVEVWSHRAKTLAVWAFPLAGATTLVWRARRHPLGRSLA